MRSFEAAMRPSSPRLERTSALVCSGARNSLEAVEQGIVVYLLIEGFELVGQRSGSEISQVSVLQPMT